MYSNFIYNFGVPTGFENLIYARQAYIYKSYCVTVYVASRPVSLLVLNEPIGT